MNLHFPGRTVTHPIDTRGHGGFVNTLHQCRLLVCVYITLHREFVVASVNEIWGALSIAELTRRYEESSIPKGLSSLFRHQKEQRRRGVEHDSCTSESYLQVTYFLSYLCTYVIYLEFAIDDTRHVLVSLLFHRALTFCPVSFGSSSFYS